VKKKIFAQIPVRKGSQRVPDKSTRPFAGTTVLDITIQKALQSKLIDKIFLNTNCEKAMAIAAKYKEIEIYRRPEKLCEAEVTLDTFTQDFMQKNPADYTVLVNPISPNLGGDIIDYMIEKSISEQIDSHLTICCFKLHSFYEGKPLNFNLQNPIPQTQNISPVEIVNWAYAVWKNETFLKNTAAVFSGKVIFFETLPLLSIKVSEMEDFAQAELLYKLRP
jgi:CMP-N-acetylneuraminic acid synthetase